MSTVEQDPSNFRLIEETFKGIIVDVLENQDGSGLGSTMLCERRTYVLVNGTRLRVTEFYTRNNKIDHYYYDWVNGDSKTPILLFHSEHHEDEDYQTKTEPFHVHTNERTKLTNVQRLPNYNCRDLFSVFEFIRNFIYAKEAVQ